MSAANDALLEGFRELLATNGETLTLKRASGDMPVTGLVDRKLERTKRKLEINFDPERASMIEIPITAVTPLPRKGESFTDANGQSHRIALVLPLDGLVCPCRCDTV